MMKTTPKIRPSQRIYQGNSTAWWMTYLQANPLQSAFAVTCTIGGMLLLIFFAQLHAMPELDLAGATSLLLAVAAVGLVFTFLPALCAIGAGLSIQTYGPEAAPLREGRSAWLLPVQVIGSLVGSGIVWYIDPSEVLVNWLIFLLMVVGAAVYAWWLPGSLVRDLKTRVAYFFAYVWLSMVYLMTAGLAFVSFWTLSSQGANTEYRELRLLGWMIYCIFLNQLVAQLKYFKLGIVFTAICLSALVLFSISNSGMAVPKAVVRSLGLGEMPVALVVTEAGCQQLNQASGIKVCEVRPNEKSALVCPVLLRSRIGSPYFIGFSPLSPQSGWPANALPTRLEAVAIPKSEVLGWSRIDFKPADKSTMERDAAAGPNQQGTASQIVTRWNTTAQGDWLARQCGLPD
jgi:hypothetical protein